MRSPRRLGRRGGDEWSYATDVTGQVLWYCPSGGAEKYTNRVGLKKYWEARYPGAPYPSFFTFRAADAPPHWRRVEHREDDEDDGEDDGQENSKGAASGGSAGGGSAGVRGREAHGSGAGGNGSATGEVRRRAYVCLL